LQSLQDELENSEESWAKLQAAANNLKKNCSPSFAEIIDQKCTEAHTRYAYKKEPHLLVSNKIAEIRFQCMSHF